MKSIIIVISTLILLSCQTKTSHILDIHVPQIELNATTTIKLPAQAKLNPKWFLAHDDYFIIVNDKNKNILSIYNNKSGAIQTLQDKGRAANEIVNVNQVGVYTIAPNFSFYIHDDIKDKLFIYRLCKSNFKLSEILDVPAFNSFAIDNSIILGVPSIGNERYIANDLENNINIEFGNYNEYTHDVPLNDKTLFTGNHVINTQRKRFAWLSLYGESINIFDYNDIKNIKEINKTTYLEPALDYNLFKRKGVVILYPETKIAFTSITHSDSCIYALYSGYTLMDFVDIKSHALHGHNILMFDWNGNYIKKIYRHDTIVAISYDNSRKILYILKYNDRDENYEIDVLNSII